MPRTRCCSSILTCSVAISSVESDTDTDVIAVVILSSQPGRITYWPGLTMMSDEVQSENPLAVTLTAYVPGSTLANAKNPLSFDRRVRGAVRTGPARTTVAPERVSPVPSVTVPVICPLSGLGVLVSCAARGDAIASAAEISTQIRSILTPKAPIDSCGIGAILA